MTSPSRLIRELAVLGIAALVLGALGPFGSFAWPLGTRIAQWSLMLFAGYAFFRPVIAGGSALAAQSGLPRGAAILVACLFGAIPTTILVALAFGGFRWRAVTVGDLAALYPLVLLIGGAITAVQMLARRAREGSDGAAAPLPEALAPEPAPPTDSAIAPPDPSPARPAFFDLLPPALGTDIRCLENEDHYVRVHTAAGSALVLIRMRDAVAQLEEVAGARVHRGWWVARTAVAGVIRQDRNVRLRLVDDREVPVARANVAALRDAGWLD
ncbi:LytTR family DNA-binding domain-containing protein [Sphingomonas sp. CJ20]